MHASIAPFLVLAALSTPLRAQGWEVDLALANLQLDAETYADHECNGPSPVLKILPFPYDVLPLVLPPGVPSDHRVGSENTLAAPFYLPSPAGARMDLGAELSVTARDMCPFATEAVSTAAATFLADGLGTRTLSFFWSARVNNGAVDGDFFDRGCVIGTVGLRASRHNLPPTTRPWILRTDWLVNGSADSSHECPGGCPPTATPPMEDPGAASMILEIEINQGGPQVLAAEVLDPDAGLAPIAILDDSFETTFAPGAGTIDVDLDITALAAHTLMFPTDESSTANFDAFVWLYLISHDFVTLEPFRSYMRVVPGGGSGPVYSFRQGRYEVTNQHYADFLNAAEVDGGGSGIGSYLVFGADGRVTLPDGTLVFEPSGVGPGSRIAYTPGAPIGTRYTVEIQVGADPRSYERHPVTNVSWLGAVKFCNWLTLERGHAPSLRCYTEGATADEWHPVTISTADWSVRDLNFAERALLVRMRGFRLPMDDSGGATGWLSSQPSAFNEWYKAAAYDPQAPATTRTGPGGETVPPRHWIYGIGRDVLGAPDANFAGSSDPFDDDDAFVGLYDGTHYNPIMDDGVGDGTSFASAAGANPYGFYDLSGSVAEWMQDRVAGTDQALRGGSFYEPLAASAAAFRRSQAPGTASDDVGFRVVQSVRPRIRQAVPVQHP